ncbi:MAG: nucleotidyltransferase substrate binding protein, partial [Myxococcota bacterium]
ATATSPSTPTYARTRLPCKAYGHGGKKLDATPIKELLRLAATHGLMTVEEVSRWFAYRDNRNSTAHDYGEGFAHETLTLLPGFIADAKTLEALLRTKFSE